MEYMNSEFATDARNFDYSKRSSRFKAVGDLRPIMNYVFGMAKIANIANYDNSVQIQRSEYDL